MEKWTLVVWKARQAVDGLTGKIESDKKWKSLVWKYDKKSTALR